MKWGFLEALFLLGLAAYVLAGREAVPFHGDESMHIAMSRDYYYLVQNRNLEPVLYDPHPAPGDLAAAVDHHLRIMNGTVTKMSIGLAWDLAGMTADDLNGPWVWGVPDEWAWNQEHHNLPSDRLLHTARIPSTVFTALSVILVFGIARMVVPGRWGAWAAALIYATHPAVLVNGRRAMMEGSLLFFSALVILIALWVERDLRRATPRRAVMVVALGVASGFAFASKHSAVITVAAVFGALALAPVIGRGSLASQEKTMRRAAPQRDKNTFFSLYPLRISVPSVPSVPSVVKYFFVFMGPVFGAAALALFTFLALNPAWWRDPLRMPGRVLDERRDLLNAQIESAQAFCSDYTGLGDRLAGLVDQIAFAGPQFYEVPVWEEFVGADIRAYRGAWYAGRGVIWGIPLLAVFGIGLVNLARRWRDGGAWIILFAFGVTALASLALIPFAWQRYYLWLCAPVAVIAGAGVGFIESFARRSA